MTKLALCVCSSSSSASSSSSITAIAVIFVIFTIIIIVSIIIVVFVIKCQITNELYVLASGTDEKAIIRVLSRHNNRQRQIIKETYKTSFGRVGILVSLIRVLPPLPISLR